MSVVIVGGHDRMVCQYMKICKNYKCKAKVFTQMSASMDKQMGSPDLFILFTNTVSHKESFIIRNLPSGMKDFQMGDFFMKKV